MSDVVISVEGLGKKYRLGANRQRYGSLRESLAVAGAAPLRAARRITGRRAPDGDRGLRPEIWALRNVGLEVKRGEVLGIIGRNGAGKSTLLKLLGQITEPTEGRIRVKGRVASLLEVGTGFHPELTGRENIYLNGAILGMAQAEIARKFEEIVAFAEVESFIDTQAKHYSSGMYMRLAFSVAAHLETEVLFIDEVLAVGDAQFQRKCLGKMANMATAGRTVLFVSHNLVALENLCSRAIWLDHGALVREGETGPTVRSYLAATSPQAQRIDLTSHKRQGGDQTVRFTSLEVLGRDLKRVSTVRTGEGFSINLSYSCAGSVMNPVFALSIFSEKRAPIFAIHTSDVDYSIPHIEGKGAIWLDVLQCNLLPGTYSVDVAVGDSLDALRYDHLVDAARFDIQPADVYGSGRLRGADWTLIFLPCKWRTTS